MKHNKLNKLGFLSFFIVLGILGVITKQKELQGFWGFAVYFRYFFVTPDELFIGNTRKAASIGFFSGIIATTTGIAVRTLMPSILTGQMVLASCFVVSMFCFTISLVILEVKEMRA